MAICKSFNFVSLFSKFSPLCGRRFSTLSRKIRKMNLPRQTCYCYYMYVEQPLRAVNLDIGCQKYPRIGTRLMVKCFIHPRQHVRNFSSMNRHTNEEENSCVPPKNIPKVEGPTLCDCSSPQAAVTWWSTAFSKWGIPESRVSAEFIVAHSLGLKQLHELANTELERPLTHAQLKQINCLCNKRMERVPVQYIIGDWDFRDITLLVRPPVLIPRPETELLVDVILGHYPEAEDKRHFLEIGCGSGAISASILTEMPRIIMTAVDYSEEAVKLTTENAERLGVLDRLTVHRAEVTSTLPSCLQGMQDSFDAIISNPPYIATPDMADLAPEITLYEDHRALCGGSEGMDLIKDILRNARHLLKPGSSIWLETDTKHPQAIREWLQSNPESYVEFIRTFQDYNDRSRFSQLMYQP